MRNRDHPPGVIPRPLRGTGSDPSMLPRGRHARCCRREQRSWPLLHHLRYLAAVVKLSSDGRGGKSPMTARGQHLEATRSQLRRVARLGPVACRALWCSECQKLAVTGCERSGSCSRNDGIGESAVEQGFAGEALTNRQPKLATRRDVRKGWSGVDTGLTTARGPVLPRFLV